MSADRFSRDYSRPAAAAGIRVLAAVVILAALGCSGSSSPTSPSAPPTPSLTCPADITETSIAGESVVVTYTTPIATGGVAPVEVSCAPPSETKFPVGTTSVLCTATSSNHTTASCAFNVIVAPPSAQVSKTRYLAFGDSFTAGEVTAPVESAPSRGGPVFHPTVLVPQASYPTQLEQLLRGRYAAQSASISVTNAGRAGERATEGMKRFPGVMASARPEVTLLLDGANDLALGHSAVAAALDAVEWMARDARGRGALVFLATLPPPRPGGSRSLSPSLVQEYNAGIRAIASSEGAVLVDLFSALSTSVDTYIGVDGLHPNEAGYRKMAEVFFDAVRAELETHP